MSRSLFIRLVYFFCFFFLLFPEGRSALIPEEIPVRNTQYENGFDDGYQDATDGMKSLCKIRKCRSKHSYERGYRLGYKKGISERMLVGPLIDSPGKTIGSDFNGDGIHDVIMGARGNDLGGVSAAGAVYVFFGSTTLGGTNEIDFTAGGGSPNATFTGDSASDQLGRGLSAAGDVNGDGIDDIIAGAFGRAAGVGGAYIFFGSTTLSGTNTIGSNAFSPDVTMLGDGALDYFGRAVSALGDINGDGFDDVGIGAPDSSFGGVAVYIFFGANNLSGTKDLATRDSADVTVFGSATNAIGFNVSGAGDVNGDGFDDIIIGEYGNDVQASNAGAAYVFFGSSTLSGNLRLTGTSSANVTFIGKSASDNLGQSVSGGGDINGDGVDDVIIGADGVTIGALGSVGAIYVFFGATSLSGNKRLATISSADMTVFGRSSTLLGRYVSNAGDINDDGFDDILTGNPTEDLSLVNSGAAFAFFGASTLGFTIDPTNTLSGFNTRSPDVTIIGDRTNDYLGRNLSGAGDVNADGIPDFIVGADSFDPPNRRGSGTMSAAGAAYVFFGATSLGTTTKNLATTDSADVSFLGKAASDNLGTNVGGGRSFPGQ